MIPFEFGGLRIIEDASLVETVEDWSRVRSPGRARRRRRKHRQNIEIRTVPREDVFVQGRVMVMHPVTAAKLRSKMAEMGGL